MEHYLNPLVASFIGKEGGLPVDERVALTAAAMVISGPLALAPALVAVQRRREMGKPDDPGPGAPGDVPGPVGPPLTEVPDLIGQPLDDARSELKERDLVSVVSWHESTEEEKGLVLAQPQPPMVGEMVDAGTRVTLKIGAGQPKGKEPECDDATAIAELRRDVDRRLSEIQRDIAKLTEILKPASSSGASTAPSGDKKQTAS